MTGYPRRRVLRGGLALAGLGLGAGCGIPFPRSPAPARPHRIGILVSTNLATTAPNLEALRQGLRDVGYVEGQNLAIEVRVAEGRQEPLPGLAAELVGLGVDVLVVSGNVEARAARQATATVPIVFTLASDPVGEGLVASLAHPGGNATGLTQEAGQESAKRLELLKEAVPGLSRAAVLWNRQATHRVEQTEAAARRLGVQALRLDLERPEDLEPALAAALAWRADGLVVLAGGVSLALAPQIVDFAAANRLPAMYFLSLFPRAGGLMFYGPSTPENYRRAAAYVDKILTGTSPADLPIEQPTTFDFVINLKAARALGLTLPASVLQQATEVIQ